MKIKKLITVFIPLSLWVANSYSQKEAASVWIDVGNIHLEQGRLEQAEEAFRKALDMDEKAMAALSGLGRIRQQKEEWGKSKDWFEKILEFEPHHLEAHYYLGIADRETGKYKAIFMRYLDWKNSEKHFKSVIERDSLYRDVLYQFALLKRYQKKYVEAICLDHQQIRLRPELLGPQKGIFKLYDFFLNHVRTDSVLAWLQAQDNDHARYFLGDKYRRMKNFTKADSIFQSLLAGPLQISRHPILLSYVRLYLEQGDPLKAEETYWQTVESIERDLDAELVFEDLKYIITDQELDQYRHLTAIEEKKDFFRKIWRKRNPLPASPDNVRLAEHYRRLVYVEENYRYDGFRLWFNNPDVSRLLTFPKSFYLNEEFNDKGLIYLRHGPPDDTATALGENVPFNESWLYYETPRNPRFIFHFEISKDGLANNWRLLPFPTNAEAVEARIDWDIRFYQWLTADSQVERYQLANEIAWESRKMVEVGMTTDRHTWEGELKPLFCPFYVANFRGQNGKNAFELYYAIPVSDLFSDKNRNRQALQVEKGIAIHDLDWNEVVKQSQSLTINKDESQYIHDHFYIDEYRFEVKPDKYHVALHVREPQQNIVGGWKFKAQLPNYTPENLRCSDIELAYSVEPAEGKGRFVKNGLKIIPNPTKRFNLDQPVYVYYEIYNLEKDESGVTSYEVEHTVTQLERKRAGLKKIFSLFSGGSKSIISTKTQRLGTTETAIEYVAFDLSKLAASKVKFQVMVNDLHSNQKDQSDIELELY